MENDEFFFSSITSKEVYDIRGAFDIIYVVVTLLYIPQFRGMLKYIVGGYTACSNLAEKSFAGGSRTAKFMNVFSLESFPLYGIEVL